MPCVIKSAELAKMLGVDPSTLWRWQLSDAGLAGCVIKRTKHSTYWSVQRLQDRGFLTKPEATNPFLSFDYQVSL